MVNSKVLMKGNEALAEAALRSGCKCFFGYPITPQTEIGAYMSKRMPKLVEDSGKGEYTFLQAESEISAINMIYGCAATGTRCMTSSSSPGISLKAEGLSYIAGADLPCVIVNVQRGGPGLGGIQPSQADYFQATKAPGHGDFHLVVFAPSSVQEIVDLTSKAFEVADKYRVPVMLLLDGLLGQMMEPVCFEENSDGAKDEPEKDWATVGHGNKRSKNIASSLYLDPNALNDKVKERFSRYELIAKEQTLSENYLTDDADVLVVAYGSTARIAKTAVNQANAEGLKIGLFRPISLYPFPSNALCNAVKNAKKILVVEMSAGQMIQDVKLSLFDGLDGKHIPVDFYGETGGVVPTPNAIYEKIKSLAK